MTALDAACSCGLVRLAAVSASKMSVMPTMRACTDIGSRFRPQPASVLVVARQRLKARFSGGAAWAMLPES